MFAGGSGIERKQGKTAGVGVSSPVGICYKISGLRCIKIIGERTTIQGKDGEAFSERGG